MILDGLAIAAGVFGVGLILSAVVRTVVIPRPERVWLTRMTFRSARAITNLILRRVDDPIRRDRWLGMFGPVALLMLPVVWSLGSMVAYAAIYWGLGAGSVLESLEFSGSSLTTLGFVPATDSVTRLIAVSEGLLGLGIVALMISFIPSIYSTFSHREVAVGRLTVRAGEPPSPGEFIIRLVSIGQIEHMASLWGEWEDWFVELGETHTSFPSLVFFRSMSPNRSWLTAAEASLDAAAIIRATGMATDGGHADTMIRAGYLALRSIADFFEIEPELSPENAADISIERAWFDAIIDRLEAAGCVFEVSRDEAWRSFCGWRVNYDRAVVGLATVVGEVESHWRAVAD